MLTKVIVVATVTDNNVTSCFCYFPHEFDGSWGAMWFILEKSCSEYYSLNRVSPVHAEISGDIDECGMWKRLQQFAFILKSKCQDFVFYKNIGPSGLVAGGYDPFPEII